MPTCFVIMPLTTPPSMVQAYGGDDQHFLHVLDHLFIPAIRAAGFEPIRPSMRGDDLIPAEIIRNLEEAELVLCDASALNANVFFELGIRTALDRPVAMVKDDRTLSYPFDTSMINHHTYNSGLAPWTLAADIERLAQHLTDAGARAAGRNSLWRYFGLTQRAAPAVIQNPVEEKVDLLISEVEKLKASSRPRRVSMAPLRPRPGYLADLLRAGADQVDDVSIPNETVRDFLIAASDVAAEVSAGFRLKSATSNSVVLDLSGYLLSPHLADRIQQRAARDSIAVTIENLRDSPD